MNTNPEHETLFSRVCDGIATATEISDFHRLLRTDADALDAWLRYSALHVELAGGSTFAGARPAERGAEPEVAATGDDRAIARVSRARFSLQWIPHAAAGLLFGLFAASIVWAYVVPPVIKAHPLLTEDFEIADALLATRVPLETGVWRGDTAEVVGPQHGVTPASGLKMMRFLRADVETVSKPTGGHIAVVYRLIDLRPFRSELADGEGVVEVSASFNAMEFPAEERYGCAISLFALDADSVPDRAGRLGSTLTNESLAMARSSRTKIDRDPASWQRLTTELRLPPNAEFLAVRLHISQAFESGENHIFTGSYADDVRISLSRRPPLP